MPGCVRYPGDELNAIGSRTRPRLWPIVVARFSSSTAYYTLVPVVAAWLIQTKAVPSATAASAAGVLVFSTRAGYLVAVPIERALGPRLSLVLVGGVAAGACTLGQLMPSHPGTLVLYSFIAVLGTAASGITLVLRVLVAEQFSADLLGGYAYLNLAVNIGAAAGPIIGTALLAHRPRDLLVCVAAFQIVAVAAAVLISGHGARHERHAGDGKAEPTEAVSASRHALVRLLVFAVLSSLTFGAYGAVFDAMPNVLATGGLSWTVSVMFIINAALVIVLQLPVGRWISRRVGSDGRSVIGWASRGNVAVVCGCLVLLLASLPHSREVLAIGVLAAVAVFTIGEVIFTPLYDSSVAMLSTARWRSGAFAGVGLLWGTLEAGATSAGILLMTHSGGAASVITWSLAVAVALIGAVGLHIISRPKLNFAGG